VATVDDAIEVLTDPALKAKGGRPRPNYVRMRPDDVIGALLRREAGDKGEARALVIEALDKLGGEIRTRFDQGGVRAGARSRHQEIDEFWVPESALRPQGH
jgi:hypothetical protein